MKIKTINVYSFDELNEKAKQKAIDNYRNTNSDDSQFIYDEANESVIKFHEIFGTNEGSHSWLDCRFDSIDNNILELKGLRLRTYIINNFYNDIYKGKYYKSWTTKNKVIHRKVKSICKSKKTGWHDESQHGEYWNTYYGLKLDNCCVLTGICYDNFLLQPIYDFIDWKSKPDYHSYTDFESLMTDCLASLKDALESEVESRNEDEYIKEEIEANEYEFYEDGNML
jgi:hypothetical protein